MMTARDVRRRVVSQIMTGLCIAAVALALVPVLIFSCRQAGISSLDLNFHPDVRCRAIRRRHGELDRRVSILCGLGAIFAIPIGVMSGIYIVESGAPGSPRWPGSQPIR
jgi:ABC-type phosphate transport system permease subunit